MIGAAHRPVYADYTASGRCLRYIEDYAQEIAAFYANPHTDDDETGRRTNELLYDAERRIKQMLNAGPRGCLIACGNGATAAIMRLSDPGDHQRQSGRRRSEQTDMTRA